MTAKFWIGGTATWDNTNDVNWSTSSGGVNNTTHPVAGDTVTLDGNSGAPVITVGANLAATSVALGSTGGQFAGTLNFAGFNAAFTTFAFTGTGTRTLTLSTGTFTIAGTTGNVWDITNSSGLTFTSATSSTINFTGTATSNRTIILGSAAHAYGSISVTGSATTAKYPTIMFPGAGPATVATFSIAALPIWLQIQGGQNLSLTNALAAAGSSSTYSILQSNSLAGTAATLTLAANSTLDYFILQNITRAGAGTLTATNSVDVAGNNIGASFTITPTTAGASSGHIIGG